MGNIAIHIFQYSVNVDSKLHIKAWMPITVAMYAMCQAADEFNTGLGNNFYFARGRGKRNVHPDSGRRMEPINECRMLCLLSTGLVDSIWGYDFLLGLCLY